MRQLVDICVCAKGEQLYFEEWKTWHKAQGFNNIIVYSDEDFEYSGDINRRVQHTGPARQVNTFNDYMGEMKGKEGWCLFIDVDEFADFTADDCNELIAKYPDVEAIHFQQIPYIAAEEKYRTAYFAEPVVNRFPKMGTVLHFQPGKVMVKYDNRARQGFRTAHVHGAKTHFSYRHKIRHYITKSYPEWQERRHVRGDISAGKYDDKWFHRFNEID